MGPTFNLIKNKNINKITKPKKMNQFHDRRLVIFFLFFETSFFDSRSSDRRISSGQTRKVLYATMAMRENQKHEISPIIQVKIRKHLSF